MQKIYTILISILLLLAGCHAAQPKTAIPEDPVRVNLPKYGFGCALADTKGNLWFGSSSAGLYRFRGNAFRHFSTADGLCTNAVYTIFEDQVGSLWLGTSDGLCEYDGESFRHIPIPFQDTASSWLDQVYPIINPNAVHAIIQDKTGDFWLGTGGGGGYRFDGENFFPLLRETGRRYEDSLYHNWIPDIAEDHEGNIWFASMSYGGLIRYDGNNFQQFLKKDGLSDDMIRKILVDSKGKLWLGFNGNRQSALTTFDGSTFEIYPMDKNTCHRNVLTILEDRSGRIWLGGEEGICIISQEKFTPFLNPEGQAYSGIAFILKDQANNIWFGGRNGFWKYNGNEIIALFE